MKKLIVLATLVSGLALALGAAAAFAHGGGPVGLKSGTDLTAAAAKQLGVSTATLEKAILDDANARIDKAVEDGTLDEDQAADLKDDLASHVQYAVGLTTATGVARNFGGLFGVPMFGGPITGGAKQQPAARAPGSARS